MTFHYQNNSFEMHSIIYSKLPRITQSYHLRFIIIGAVVSESIGLYIHFYHQTIEQIGGVYKQLTLAILNLLFKSGIYGETDF